MQQTTPVLRYAKPKPKVPVNEQGVPIRQRPLPSKDKKTPPPQSIAPEPASGAMRYPGEGGIESEPDDNEVPIQPEQEPAAPFDPTQPATFPAVDLGWGGGGHGLELMNQDQGPMYLAESLEGANPTHAAAAHALRAIQDAAAYHDPEGGVHRIRSLASNQLGNLPVGHVRSVPMGKAQMVIVHYPEGRGTVYRGRINE